MTGQGAQGAQGLALREIEYLPDSKRPATIYVGYAPPGTSPAVERWTIKRITVNGNLVSTHFSKWRAAAWIDRAGEDYQ